MIAQIETQVERAGTLGDALYSLGHDEVDVHDVLDALAGAGLKLVPDRFGTSSLSYALAVAMKLPSEQEARVRLEIAEACG